MKHLQKISQTPAKAQDVTPGQLLTVIAQIISVLAGAILTKENPSSTTS